MKAASVTPGRAWFRLSFDRRWFMPATCGPFIVFLPCINSLSRPLVSGQTAVPSVWRGSRCSAPGTWWSQTLACSTRGSTCAPPTNRGLVSVGQLRDVSWFKVSPWICCTANTHKRIRRQAILIMWTWTCVRPPWLTQTCLSGFKMQLEAVVLVQ